MNIRKRKGRFVIDWRIIEEHPETVLALMSKVIVVRAELMAHSMQVEYAGNSELFREVPEGETAPFYEIGVLGDEVVAREAVKP